MFIPGACDFKKSMGIIHKGQSCANGSFTVESFEAEFQSSNKSL